MSKNARKTFAALLSFWWNGKFISSLKLFLSKISLADLLQRQWGGGGVIVRSQCTQNQMRSKFKHSSWVTATLLRSQRANIPAISFVAAWIASREFDTVWLAMSVHENLACLSMPIMIVFNASCDTSQCCAKWRPKNVLPTAPPP